MNRFFLPALSLLCGFLPGFLAAELKSTQLIERNAIGSARTNGFSAISPADSGLDFTNLLKEENIIQYLYNGAGGCAGDFDQDGLVDVYLVSEDGKNKLFRQLAPWKFTDVTDEASVNGGDTWGAGAVFVDVDNDGDLDLHVSNMGSADLLYINQGDGTFSEEGEQRGLADAGPTWMANFCDYDRDGDLDCYLLTYRLFYVGKGSPLLTIKRVNGKAIVPPELSSEFYLLEGTPQEAGTADRLYENDGDGNFRPVTGSAGVGRVRNHGLSATWWDQNNDLWPDLYVANDFKSPDMLWMNQGDGTLRDHLGAKASYTSWFSMGSDFADINRDGWFDLLVADMSAMTHYQQKMQMGEMDVDSWFLKSAEPRQFMRNMLYLNYGGNRFLESGLLSGLDSTGWTWAARFEDFDCDGWEDAMFTNGMARDVNNSDYVAELTRLKREGKMEERERVMKEFDVIGHDQNKVFRNREGLRFEDHSSDWNFNALSASFGLIIADLDGDGDSDVITNNMNQKAGIYRNDFSTGNRVLLELRGRQSNHFGVGARVRLKSQSGWQMRMLTLARGYESGSAPVIHFGLGDDPEIELLEISWPSGAAQTIEGLAVNHRHVIHEPEGTFTPNPARTTPPPQRTLFSQNAIPGLNFTHTEDTFDDYEEQPLLPWGLSRLGPGLAFGDADADGDEDLWVGGASGQPGRIIERSESSGWSTIPWGPWYKDAATEDMGALFFDPDKDGDLDLYVASGGNRVTFQGEPVLEDRLYINVDPNEETDSPRGFAKANPDPNPENRAFESAGSIAAADFDRDGDMDFLVTSRTTPGKIHEAPPQRLLANVGDRLADVTEEIAPGLKDIGMATSAIWSDIDRDEDLDLLVTTAWGPIRVFLQEEGTLKKMPEGCSLSDAHGWWQGIDGGDFDGDGDMDFIATNLGLNTKYKASLEKPIQVYLSDFDGNGTFDIVESKYEGKTLYPMRGRSCSSDAMPFISEKFETFHAFASAELSAIYTEPELEQAKVIRFTRLETSVLLNDGTGRFDLLPLPTLAQISPGFGVAVEDFDGDGTLDAVIAQNFYDPQPETGRMSGGLGLFLRGNGDGTFTEVWPQESGIELHEDAKSLAIGDLNNDGAPDLVCGINNGSVVSLVNQTRAPNARWTTIQLQGLPGNPTAIGASLSIDTSEGRTLRREVRAGSSYLSQSTPRRFVALGLDEWVSQVEVTWPTGGKSSFNFDGFATKHELQEASE